MIQKTGAIICDDIYNVAVEFCLIMQFAGEIDDSGPARYAKAKRARETETYGAASHRLIETRT